jgi:two-component system response regulator RegA
MTALHQTQADRKLLLVDDDRIFAQVTARALARRGFEVTVAHDVDAALGMVSDNTDFAVVDLALGNASGLSLLIPLKQMNPSMRILMLSGYASSKTVEEAIRLGATQYLAKPADADEIVAALTNDQGKP